MEMEKLMTELRDRFSKAIEEASASVGMIDDIVPDKADALRERIHNIITSTDMSMRMICEEISVENGDKEAIACHAMMIVDAIHQMDRIPYLCQVYKFQYT